MSITFPAFIDDSNEGFLPLREAIKGKRVFVIADRNTEKFCLPLLAGKIQAELVLVVENGESAKSLTTATWLWNEFLKYNVSRKDVILALGGGCVTDVAGFVAAVFKRGIPFIALPTTLLGMTDAALGGKNGVDFENYKNMLGVIREPEHVFIWPEFLSTLPKDEILSGYAETLKHALIADAALWESLPYNFPKENALEIIKRSVRIKMAIVEKDPQEKNLRRLLNFGHTIGHAIESCYLQGNKPVLHGFAVAAGMCVETFLSIEHGLKESTATDIVNKLNRIYSDRMPLVPSYDELSPFLMADKKNEGGKMLFTLLQDAGNGISSVPVWKEEIKSAFRMFREITC